MSDESAPGQGAVLGLRNSLGDRKLPGISRKITACVTCRRLKIKCCMTRGKPPCARCKAQNLSCVVNKSLQTLLESDATWKETVDQRICKIERVLFRDPEPSLSSVPIEIDGTMRTSSRASSSIPRQLPTPTGDTTLDLSCSLGAFPASSIMAATNAKESASLASLPDLISREIISLDSAKEHLAFFKHYLDPFVHHAVGEAATITEIRTRSSLLTTSICTVAAYCAGSDQYPRCLVTLKEEVSYILFANRYTFDDVLALCIGALWLLDISSALQGLAVRISSQLDLHRCITKMPHRDITCYRRTRLYFLVFLCDHHCSLVHGKPTMTHEWRSLKHPATLLQSEYSVRADLFLVCQVELWSLNRQVFETFGADVHDPAASRNTVEVERLKCAYADWYSSWKRALNLRYDPTSRLHHIFEFYYQSGMLFLLSHVFRGQPTADPPATRVTANQLSHEAFDSALSFIQAIAVWPDVSEWLSKLPSYFRTMIAFASVCLVRTLFQPEYFGAVNTIRVFDQMQKLSAILRSVAAVGQPLLNFASSLESALNEWKQGSSGADGRNIDLDLGPDFDWGQYWDESLQLDLLEDQTAWAFLINGNKS